jgi:hypothetical protein
MLTEGLELYIIYGNSKSRGGLKVELMRLKDPKVAQRSALLICQFAMAMMDQVKAYNKKVMFDYKLRVGELF